MKSDLSVLVAGIRVRSNEDGLYSLNDLHKASGGEKRHSPNYWLNLESTKDILEEIGNDNTVITVFTKEGRGGGTFVDKLLLGMYASWISPKFHINVYRVFFEEMERKNRKLEIENSDLTDFKDKIYRLGVAKKHLSSDYSQFYIEVITSIKRMLRAFSAEREVNRLSITRSPLYGREVVRMEAWKYLERNLIECINPDAYPEHQKYKLIYSL